MDDEPLLGPPRVRHKLAELARECGASRATLARRFTELVGEAPMSFLTSWRISLAADLLRVPGVAEVWPNLTYH